MPLPSETQVLIVGAGPVGLVCAITLAKLGIQAVVVDARGERTEGARSTLVHARTFELLKTIGISDDLKDIGIQSKGIVFYAGSKPLFNVDVAGLANHTGFPFILLSPQTEVEDVFAACLANCGVEVIKNTRVIGLQEDSNADGLHVSFEDGSDMRASYVVGADGARSTIRSLAGISFKDPITKVKYDENPSSSSFMQITLADVYLEVHPSISIPRDVTCWHLNGRILFCPINPREQQRGQRKGSFWRLALATPPGSPNAPPRYPDHAYIQKEIDDRKPWKQSIRVEHLDTSATYRVRAAVADTFFKRVGTGKILLVGDSAHVHSPTGGQGMNLGICDAVALGRAIGEHIRGGETDTILLEYSAKRRETAIKVIQATKMMSEIINVSDGWRRTLTNAVIYLVSWITPIRKRVAWRLSGLAYRD